MDNRLTKEQIQGWKMNNGAMSPNEFRALCDLALAALPEIGTHTDHPLRHFDRTCPACTEGDTPRTDAEARAEAVIAAAERVSHLPSELCDFIREQAALLTEHRDNGRRLMESADGWKAEAERLRGIERALERANEEIASRSASVPETGSIEDVRAKLLKSIEREQELEARLASKTRDADHFFQLSGRYLEELNALQSAKPLLSHDREAIELAATILEQSKDNDTRMVASDLRAIVATGSCVAPVSTTQPRAIADVAAERQRQKAEEGWTEQHDDGHDSGELACAGAAYALNAGCLLYPLNGTPLDEPPEFWMWDRKWWKPKDARRDLIRAAALIVAEIERLDRAASRAQSAIQPSTKEKS